MITSNFTQMLVDLSEKGHNQLLGVCCCVNHGIYVNEISAIGFQIAFVFSQSERFHVVKNSHLEGDRRGKEIVHKDGPNVGSVIPESRICNQVLNQLLQRGDNGTKNQFGESFVGIDSTLAIGSSKLSIHVGPEIFSPSLHLWEIELLEGL